MGVWILPLRVWSQYTAFRALMDLEVLETWVSDFAQQIIRMVRATLL